MEPDAVEIAQQFARELGKLHQQAGRPSLAKLGRLSSHYLRRATVSDVLNGNRVRVPDWPFVSSFVTACHASALENHLDLAGFESMAEWKERWDAATSPVATQPPPDGDLQEADSPAAAAPAALAGEPALMWLPPRMSGFTGREDALEDVRRDLVRDTRTSAVAIQGLCGIGKTQLAIEYAHRYAASYDLIWWVPCDDRATALDALAELSERLGLGLGSAKAHGGQPQAPRPNPAGPLLEALRVERPFKRWLLILDNASEPDEIWDLIPPPNGHTLITTRNSRWQASAHRHELDVLARTESVEMLRARLRGLTEADAHRLAEAVGDLPLVLEHAVEAGLPVADYLAQMDSDPLGLLATRPSGYPVDVAEAWTETLYAMRANSEDAWDLLCCLSFFGTESVSRGYLDDARNVPGISVHGLLSDTLRLNQAIRALGYRGLLRVYLGTNALHVHRVTQCIVRHLVASE